MSKNCGCSVFVWSTIDTVKAIGDFMIGSRELLRATALMCSALLVPGDVILMAQQPSQTSSPPAASAAPSKPIAPDQLDSLVAPIALYPDPLLAQVLAAST